MKVGTVPKITAGAVAIIVLAFIGTRQFISSKEENSPTVEIVTSTESANLASQTDATRKGTFAAPSREGKPQISAEEIRQIEDFFAQLEGADAQSGMDAPRFPTDSEAEVAQNTDEHTAADTDAYGENAEDIEQTAEEVMNDFVEAFRNLDFETMGLLTTGAAKEEFGSLGTPLIDPEELKDFPAEMRQMVEQMSEKMFVEFVSRIEVVKSEHVGDEFHFELGGRPPEVPETPGLEISFVGAPNELFKMRKENGAWRVYESETLD